MIHFDPKPSGPGNESTPSVCAIGIGGAGCNVLDRLALGRLPEAELVSMSADVRVLNNSMAQRKVQLGAEITRGLGAGGDPELGRQLAEATAEEISSAVNGRSIVLVCAGLGGGTGSGVTPFVVEQARAAGAFVVVFAVLPFPFEGRRRTEQAEATLVELETAADVLVTFENARMGGLALPKEGIQGAFAAADDTLGQSIRAVAGIVLRPGIIRVGLDDLTSALRNEGSRCLFGYGEGQGDARATNALQKALKSPLLDNGTDLKTASTVLAHVAGGNSMSLYEVELVMTELAKHVSEDANLLFGTGTDKSLGEKMVVTLVSSVSVAAKVEPPVELLEIESKATPEPLVIEPIAEPEPVKDETPIEHGESVAKALAAITAAVAAAPANDTDAQFALDFGFEPEDEQAESSEEEPTAQDLQEEDPAAPTPEPEPGNTEILSAAEESTPEPAPKEAVVIESLVIEDATPSVATAPVPTKDVSGTALDTEIEAIAKEAPEEIEAPTSKVEAEEIEEELTAEIEGFVEEAPEEIEAIIEEKPEEIEAPVSEAIIEEETITEIEANAGEEPATEIEAIIEEELEEELEEPVAHEDFLKAPESEEVIAEVQEEPIAVEEIFAEEPPEPIEETEPFIEIAAPVAKKLSLVDRLLQNREAFFAEETEEPEEENAGFGEALLQEPEEVQQSIEADVEEPVAYEPKYEPEPSPIAEEPQEVEEAMAAFEDATDPATLEESEPSYYDEPTHEPEPQVAAKGAGQSMLEFGHAASSGRFQNADPTISEEGDDLDIPTFLRKRMANKR